MTTKHEEITYRIYEFNNQKISREDLVSCYPKKDILYVLGLMVKDIDKQYDKEKFKTLVFE